MQPLARGEKMKKNVLKNADIIRQGTLIIVLVLEMILFTALSDSFLTGSNLVNVLRQTSVTAISAVGMFMIILLGDIDLSVGSVYALIGVLCAYVFQGTESAVITVIAALALGTFIGFASGFVSLERYSGITARFPLIWEEGSIFSTAFSGELRLWSG